MSEASIVLKVKNEATKEINSIASAFRGLSKAEEEAEKKSAEYSKKLGHVRTNLAKLQTKLLDANQELKNAKKTYKDLNDEASRNALVEAQKNVNRLREKCSGATKEINATKKALNSLEETNRRSGAGSGSGFFDLASRLQGMGSNFAKSGLWQALGNWGSELAGISVQSRFGDSGATMFSEIIGGAATGASVGSFFGPVGTAIGALIGTATGAISGGTKNFEKKDEYFKNAVQESYEGFKQNREEMVTSGSSVAASREVDELAFNKLLGAGIGTEYLEDLRDLAAHTPLEYDQLTEISRQLAIGFGDESDRMLDLIEVVGDAGSAVGLDSSGMVTIATALSRMQSSDKVTLEYLNLIQERGIDASSGPSGHLPLKGKALPPLSVSFADSSPPRASQGSLRSRVRWSKWAQKAPEACIFRGGGDYFLVSSFKLGYFSSKYLR